MLAVCVCMYVYMIFVFYFLSKCFEENMIYRKIKMQLFKNTKLVM